MLQLKGITKVYGKVNEGGVVALREIDLSFRRNEFVSILGQSGCGKTTLLNVIGGLDHYSAGDLIIDGRSTKEFRDADWDSYRNHSIGFVFQSYNLISHQTVLSNVELALTLSGVSKAERRARAEEALARVGLSDQLHKKPNQLSGGQMQRVAIARALVNNPEILLADEPTGALDSATSVQIMDLLKEIAKDRLVIMVTHNPELAEQYSTRIIRLLDGRVIGDTNPPTDEELSAMEARPVQTKKDQKKAKSEKTKKTSMSFLTALSLSLTNLMTKKGRTFLTSFAGSIGIIGIALILAVSTGVQGFINSIQEDTLSSYPITLQAETLDMSSMMLTFMESTAEDTEDRELDKVYSNIVMYQLMNAFIGAETQKNNLGGFKGYMESTAKNTFDKYASAIQYLYDVNFDVYTMDVAGNTVRVDASEVFNSVLGDVSSSSMMSSYSNMMSSASAMDIWEQLIPGKADAAGNRAPVSEILKDQYQLLSGEWPSAKDEVVIIVNSRNELSDMALYALGLKDRSELSDIMAAILAQDQYEAVVESWSYSYIREHIPLSLYLPTDYYEKVTADGEDPIWVRVEDPTALGDGLALKVSGIISPAEGSSSTALTGSIGYTYMLTDYIMESVAGSEIVTYQLAHPNYDVLSGNPFELDEENEPTDAERAAAFLAYVDTLTDKQKADLMLAIYKTVPQSTIDGAVNMQMASMEKKDGDGNTVTDGDGKTVYDREKMENFIRTNFSQVGASVSSELVEKYIKRLDDGELEELIRTTVASAVEKMAQAQAERQFNTMLDTVTPEELAVYKQSVLAELPDRNYKTGFLIQNYTELTSLPQDVFAAHLITLSDGEIDTLLDTLLTRQGTEYLTEKLATDEDYRNRKAAAMLGGYLTSPEMTEEKQAELYDAHVPKPVSGVTYEENMEAFGLVGEEEPASIVIYVSTFEDKEYITGAIDDYNAAVENEEDQINFTDYVALLMSSVTTIVDAISYVLIAFVAISLVVSSIMIGIITYISVLERTKEIGILRAIGASKGDISRVFNAETLTVGFVAGAIGIGVTLILIVIINIILYALTGLPDLAASLPVVAALILIGISMLLTFIAGLVPASLAAKKDPVVALRTE